MYIKESVYVPQLLHKYWSEFVKLIFNVKFKLLEYVMTYDHDSLR